MKGHFIIFFILVLSPLAFSGQEGGGGMVIEQAGEYILYDFIEAGINTKAHLPAMHDYMKCLPKLSNNLPFQTDVIEGVSSMLNLIYKVHPAAAVEILNTLSKYVWQLPALDIVDAKDLGKTPIFLGNGIKVLPVAFRDDDMNVVWIRRGLWDGMNLFNRVGLIFHEVLYALSNLNKKQFNSFGARALNGFIFSPIFSSQDYEKVNNTFRMVLDPSKLLTPTQFHSISTSDYLRLCEDTKREVVDLVVRTEVFFKILKEEINDRVDELLRKEIAYSRDTFKLGRDIHLEPISIYGKEYVIPNGTQYRPDVEIEYGYWTIESSYLKKLYRLSADQVQSLRFYKGKAKELVDREKNHLFNRCLKSPEAEQALYSIKTMVVP